MNKPNKKVRINFFFSQEFYPECRDSHIQFFFRRAIPDFISCISSDMPTLQNISYRKAQMPIFVITEVFPVYKDSKATLPNCF